MTESASRQPSDGRRLRSERSKQAIIDACEALMLEGHLVPTAQMISDTAGVPIRTFFRHYPDMETLFLAFDEAMRPRYLKIYEESVSVGSLEERIAGAIELHAQSYEENRAVIQSTKAQLWRYPVLQDNYARVTKRLRKDLDIRIPELLEIDMDTREAIDALASMEMWMRLRHHQNLSRKKSKRIIRNSIQLILTTALESASDD